MTKDKTLRHAQWTVFGLAMIAYMLSFFHRVAPASLSVELQLAFAASSAELGVISAVFFLVVMLMQIPTGIIADTLGSRRILILSCICAALGAFIFSAAHSVPVAIMGRALIGLGAAVPFVALLRLNASWFEAHQFATLSGLTILLGNLGSVLSTWPLETLSHLISWRLIIASSGAMTLLAATLIYLFVRDTPEHVGLSLPGSVSTQVRSEKPQKWRQQLNLVIKNPATWPCFWVGFGICGTFFTFSSLWAVPFLMQTIHATKAEASVHVLLMILCHSVTAIGLGRTSDRIGNRKTLLLIFASLYVTMWVPILVGLNLFAGESLLVFGLQGIGSASYTLIWAIAKEVNNPKSAGMAIGVTNTSMFLCAALLQPVIGMLLDHYTVFGMQYAMALLTLVSVFGLLSGFRLAETRAKNIFNERIT